MGGEGQEGVKVGRWVGVQVGLGGREVEVRQCRGGGEGRSRDGLGRMKEGKEKKVFGKEVVEEETNIL